MNKHLAMAAMACTFAATALAQEHAPAAPAFAAPNLTPQGVAALAATIAAMKAFRDGKREATVMHQIARGFTDAEIAAMASYFAAQREGS
jgi:cytochrome c553